LLATATDVKHLVLWEGKTGKMRRGPPHIRPTTAAWFLLPRLRNDIYCVEWDVKLYCTIPYRFLLRNYRRTSTEDEEQRGVIKNIEWLQSLQWWWRWLTYLLTYLQETMEVLVLTTGTPKTCKVMFYVSRLIWLCLQGRIQSVGLTVIQNLKIQKWYGSWNYRKLSTRMYRIDAIDNCNRYNTFIKYT